MAQTQNTTQLLRAFYGVESTEGTRVAGTATTALLPLGKIGIDPSFMVNLRQFQGQMGYYTSKPGDYPDPKVTMEFELRGSGVSTDSTTLPTDIDELLKTVFGTRTADTGTTNAGTTLGVSSTTTSLVVASSSGFTVGNAVGVETGSGTGIYEVGWISAIPDGTHITLAKALTSTPTLASGSKVKPSITYTTAKSGHQSLTFDLYNAVNGGAGTSQFLSMLGCKGSAKIDLKGPGAIPTIAFDFHALGWTTATNGTMPAQTIGDSGTPAVGLGSLFRVGTTSTDIPAFSLDLGAQIARKKSQNSTYGTFGEIVTNYTPKGSFKTYNQDYTSLTALTAGTAFDLTNQWGNTVANMVAIRCPNTQRTASKFGEDASLMTDDIEFLPQLTSGDDYVYLALI